MRRALALLLACTAACMAACTAACTAGAGAPGDPLGDDGFWSLVDRAARDGGTDVQDRAAAMTQLLQGHDRAGLEAYQQHLAAAVAALDLLAVQDVAGVVCPGLDDAAFVDVRSWVVAQGRTTAAAVARDPVALARVPGVRQACTGVGSAFGDAAVPRYSDLGFEPGSDAFPLLAAGGASGPRATPQQLREARALAARR